jgi:hypothetical protein
MNSLDSQLLTNTLTAFFQNHAHLLPNYIPDSKKVSILLWAVKDEPNSFILKIADRKYVSDYRIDKNGVAYWKFREANELVIKPNPNPNSAPPNNSPTLDAVAKFNLRQTKTELDNRYGKPINPTNSNPPTESVSG